MELVGHFQHSNDLLNIFYTQPILGVAVALGGALLAAHVVCKHVFPCRYY